MEYAEDLGVGKLNFILPHSEPLSISGTILAEHHKKNVVDSYPGGRHASALRGRWPGYDASGTVMNTRELPAIFTEL
jgi:hypothetical protein